MKLLRPALMTTAVIALSTASLISFLPDPTPEPIKIKITPYEGEAVSNPVVNLEQQKDHSTRVHYFVKVGDTLSTIFSSWNLGYSTLQHVLEADLNVLKLDTIKPGDHLELVIDPESKQLQSMIFHESLVERAIYTKESDGSFEYRFEEKKGEWKETLYSGTVHGSFSTSAHRAGLSTRQIANITQVLRDKVNFARELRAGDRFEILVNHQYLGNHPTGNAEVQGISITLGNREVAAFLAEDGRFYDREGNSLEQAFDRFPIDKAYRRVTSHFNPKRKHPVTGRISPHNGTDFATPVGAPVYSTGDGKVTAIRNHPYAGKYVVIEHNNVYTTRYLHLSKFLVRQGQQVKRGQKIALAGATGRLTGPHLHFEVLVRNRAVNPLTADLPLATSIPKEEMSQFLARITEFDRRVANKRMANQEPSSKDTDV
ncbi:peptidoglycan DD-metalloendopeptidase family protein [Vibrio variabilis]|uniref:peptidoglycan DD-metalloendopeptidase family protein n=1 Tax=Vibrio variabilis TaxID=990271 RepID=UPI000DDBBC5D|nr:peptidoglycan DD-metalloendopeptidase family protein [Vibrio variabilis]